MAFSRQQVLSPRVADLSVLVQTNAPLLEQALGSPSQLRLHLQGAPWRVAVDSRQFEQALLNLVLEVGDTGSGMDEATVRQVFEPFYTTKEPGKGSGLGLSMVYGFVQQSHGHVAVESTPGAGSLFRLYFPRQGDPETVVPQRRTPAAVGQASILVVEDDALVRQYLVAQLSALGYQVRVARAGAQALEVLQHLSHLDLLLTDMSMPGTLDGLAVARAARQRFPGLPVLVSSGYSDKLPPAGTTTPEGYGVLPKPYARAELAARVREALQPPG